jgi:RNA polymerase sigma-70 factor (ECF subfamily)
MRVATTPRSEFETFFTEAEPRLRRALVARYGSDVGRDAACEALAFGWEHWERVRGMANPLGYLYRVGQSRSRRFFRRPVGFPAPVDHGLPWVEPALPGALRSLSGRQRQAVVLVEGFGYTYDEVASMLGISRSTVQNHVQRGLAGLRRALEVDDA